MNYEMRLPVYGGDGVFLRRTISGDPARPGDGLARLLPLKTKAEYAPDDIAISEAKRAVERASRCAVVARRVVQGLE